MDLANADAVGTVHNRTKFLFDLRLGVVLYLVQCAILINGEYFTDAGFSQNTALIYLVLPLGFLAYSIKNQQSVQKMPLGRTTKYAFIGFVVTPALVLAVFHYGVGVSFGTTDKTAVLGTIITMVFFVAPVEELIFRKMLPEYIESSVPKMYLTIGLILTQVAFALFHWAVYNGNVALFFIAFSMGMVWLLASRIKMPDGERLGIGFTIGSHCAYNLVVSGILLGNIAMVVG